MAKQVSAVITLLLILVLSIIIIIPAAITYAVGFLLDKLLGEEIVVDICEEGG